MHLVLIKKVNKKIQKTKWFEIHNPQGWKFTENSSKPQGWLLLKVTSPAQNLPALIKMFIVNVMIMNIQ